MRMRPSFFIGVLLLIFIASVASSQDLRPDDRYEGYPKSLIQWTSEPPDLVECQKGEYYEPSDFHLAKYENRVKVAGVRVQEFDECRWMLTSNRWRWVLRPKGTRHLIDALGRDLFDGGSPTGKPCINPSPFGFAIKPKEEPKPRPPISPLRVQPLPQPSMPQARLETPSPQIPVVIYDYVYYISLIDPPPDESVNGGSLCGKKCRWTLAAIGGAAAGYAAWYYWPCPPGTVRK